ncbi:acyl carrier protein 1 [Penicillium odoratum]|uniref:acyl carrier protein 1 n=1 Tax=Penicillium odoratum TaxID=1167516 RepID=UPI0025491E85|nr:acyl carrier protein 1 [Penicillium odoratum]KAJ5772345.1 acyl carrier protein 1 [Penicillium odoratum]
MFTIDDKVKRLIAVQLNLDLRNVTNSASFADDLGTDDFDTTDLIIALEEHFDTEVSDEEREKMKTGKPISPNIWC